MNPDDAWKPRFVDMRFDEHEATAWEKLVDHGMTEDDATTEIVHRRPGGKKTYTPDPKPSPPLQKADDERPRCRGTTRSKRCRDRA